MKKYLKTVFLVMLFSATLFMAGAVFAQTSPPTLLPATDVNIGGKGGACVGLATMIKTGDIHLRNLPCFIKYITETLIALGGSIAVLFVMVGGYKYIIGSEDKKDEAKKTITYALIGVAVSLLAWVMVDIVLQLATE